MSENKVDSIPLLLKKYFDNETFSDVVVKCDGKEFKAHRLILSAYSGFFAKMFNSPWKENKESAAKFEDVDANVVEAALQFMYSSEYSNNYGVSTMVFHAQVYGFAEKYDIPALKEYALEKFKSATSSGWTMEDFPSAIDEVFTTTPQTDRGLRDLVIQTCRDNIDQILEKETFCQVLRDTPGFAADLVLSKCNLKTGKRYKCPSCTFIFLSDVDYSRAYSCPSCGNQYVWRSFTN